MSLKNIFTYPNNLASDYVNPLYDGADTTEGWRKRANELRNGTYKTWLGQQPSSGTLENYIQAQSKWVNYFDNKKLGDNLKVYDFYNNPFYTFSLRDAGYEIDKMTIVHDDDIDRGVISYQFTNAENPFQHLQDGDEVQIINLVDEGGYSHSNTNGTYYIKENAVGQASGFGLFTDAALTTPAEIAGVHANQDDFHIIADNGGTVIFFDGGHVETFADGAKLRTAQKGANITGTCNPDVGINNNVYLDYISDNVYKVYTNVSLSTDATINSETYPNDNLVITYSDTNATGVKSFGSLTVTGGGVLANELENTTKMISGGTNITWGFCRMKQVPTNSHTYTGLTPNAQSGTGTNATMDITRNGAVYTAAINIAGSGYAAGDTLTFNGSQLGGVNGTNTCRVDIDTVDGSGAITGVSVDSAYIAATSVATGTKAPASTIDDTQWYTWKYNSSTDTLSIYTDYSPTNGYGSTVASFTVSGPTESGDSIAFTTEFIDMTDQKSVESGNTDGMVWMTSDITKTLTTVGKMGLNPILQSDGTTPFYVANVYSNYGGGNQQYKQRTGASTYVHGAVFDSKYWTPGATSATTVTSPEVMINFTISENTTNDFYNGFVGNMNIESNKGKFTTDDDRVFEVKTAADTYTPPALTTEQQEDVWDLDTEWDDQSYDGLKTFPTTVTPQDITVRVFSPSATTASQNGTKYARTAGYSKYSIDVTYPAMTAEQYLDYNGFINALNGQKHPFYFNIIQNGTRMFGREEDTAYSVAGLMHKEDADAGDTTVLIEGFAGNQADAVKRGELMVTDGKHGNIKTVGSSTDANVYGEAKFRFTTPLHSSKSAAQRIYNDPFHIIVSLDSDTVQVQRDTAGFYYLTMTFTADEWK